MRQNQGIRSASLGIFRQLWRFLDKGDLVLQGCVLKVYGVDKYYTIQKPQAPTPQAPIRNRKTRKVANANVLNRNTNLT